MSTLSDMVTEHGCRIYIVLQSWLSSSLSWLDWSQQLDRHVRSEFSGTRDGHSDEPLTRANISFYLGQCQVYLRGTSLLFSKFASHHEKSDVF